MSRASLVVLTLLLLTGSKSHAAEFPELTLDEAIREAEQGSPDVKLAIDSAEEADWKRVEALSGFLPTLSANGYHYFHQKVQTFNINFAGTEGVFPFVTPLTQFTIDANITVFDGLQNVHRYSAAKELSNAAVLNQSWVQFQIERQVRIAYYLAVAAEQIENVAEENVKTLQEHLDTTRALKRHGQGTRYDELRVRVQMKQALTDRVQSRNNVFVTRKKLAQLLGKEDDLRPLHRDLPTPDPSLTRYTELKSDVSRRTDISALDHRSTSADLSRKAAAAFWVPKFSLAGQFQWYNNVNYAIDDVKSFRNAYYVGLLLSWNIFDGAASFSRTKEALYQKQEAEDRADSARLQAHYDIESSKRNLAFGIANYQSQTDQVIESQEAVRLAHEGYKAGIRTINDVLDAQLDLYRSKAGVVNAKLSTIQSFTNLELALGKAL